MTQKNCKPLDSFFSLDRFSLVLITISIQCALFVAVLLDIPIARQIIGFFYLTFIPGFIITKMFKSDRFDTTEIVLLSVGLSIAFLMFSGLLINELYPLIGVSKPLSIWPFIITINFFLILLCSLNYFRDLNPSHFTDHFKGNLGLSYLGLFLVFSLLLMGIVGTILVINSQSSFFLLSVIVMISGLVSLSVLSERLIPSKLYPLLLLAFGLALLSFVNDSLVTRYIVGWDIHNEFYAFELINVSGRWTSVPSLLETQVLKAYASLSVTILPIIYSQVLGLDGTWVFKLFYPLITTFVSVTVYRLYCTQTGKKTALVASFFFISISMAYGWGSDKQIVAQLFYVLLFFVIFNKRMTPLKQNFFFVFFALALVMSHYSLSHIFMFTLFFTWISLSLMKNQNRKISSTFVILYFVLAFSWYIFVSSGVSFHELVNNFTTISTRFFTDFFNPQTRGKGVLRALGATSATSSLHTIGRFFFYITEFLIIVGFAKFVHMLATKKKKMNFDLEYGILICINMAILLLAIAVPNLAESWLIERFYQTTLIIIAPLCILGGYTIFKFFPRLDGKNLAAILTLGILIPQFLFSIGFIYEVSGDQSWSVPLSFHRLKNQMWLYDIIVTEQDVFGAKWLSNHVNKTNVLVNADYISQQHVLLSYGRISTEHVQVLSNTTRIIDNEGFIYLRCVNTIHGKLRWGGLLEWNTSEISSVLNNQNKIYSNGGCDIYKGFVPTNKTTTPRG